MAVLEIQRASAETTATHVSLIEPAARASVNIYTEPTVPVTDLVKKAREEICEAQCRHAVRR